MHTITLQINNSEAVKTLRKLEDKHLISILDDSDIDSPSLSGVPLSLTDFRSWIAEAEQSPTISLRDAKEKWAGQKRQLQQRIK